MQMSPNHLIALVTEDEALAKRLESDLSRMYTPPYRTKASAPPPQSGHPFRGAPVILVGTMDDAIGWARATGLPLGALLNVTSDNPAHLVETVVKLEATKWRSGTGPLAAPPAPPPEEKKPAVAVEPPAHAPPPPPPVGTPLPTEGTPSLPAGSAGTAANDALNALMLATAEPLAKKEDAMPPAPGNAGGTAQP